MKIYPEISSHMAVLVKALGTVGGDVLEIGTGLFSTPLLHWLCLDQDRKLVSYENSLKYYRFAKRFQSKTHEILYIKNWEGIEIDDKKWGVAFIDHDPMRRRKYEVIRLANNTELIVVHDTEPEEEVHYGYSHRRRGMYQHFKYIYHYTKAGNPRTSVVSNFMDFQYENI